MSARIAIAADLHVDTYGSRIDPDTGMNARLIDYLETLRWIARDARARQADVLIIAGDFTERRHAPVWLAALIRDALRLGPARQFYLRGNHDGEIGERSIVNLLDDGDQRIGVDRPRIDLSLDGLGLVMLPFGDRHWTRSGALATADEATVRRSVADDLLGMARAGYAQLFTANRHEQSILVVHQTIAGAMLSETQQAFLGDVDTVLDATALGSIGYSMVVAGHLHRHQVVEHGGPTPIVYAGSIERVDFGEEHDPKGYVIVELDPTKIDGVSWTFVEHPHARRYLTLDFGVLVYPDLGDLSGAVVRVRNVPRDVDVSELRTDLLELGAWDVHSIEHAPKDAAPAGGMSETLTPYQALYSYFDGHNDRDEIVVRGGDILEEARHG